MTSRSVHKARLLAAFIALSLLLPGCTYVQATSLYRDHPELRSVHLATGQKAEHPEALGLVYGAASGWDSCDEVARRGLLEMMEEAQAMGASRVVETKFRAKFHWTGRPVCRRTFWKKSVSVRGLAMP